ncbi:MAG: rhomboid family intramembrane serine protease [Candidatus Aenigmarchaeota archaeon]|nr:rhomboid family intramembrane serine protease [Candidatus Aenigmarchaeota archaeon]
MKGQFFPYKDDNVAKSRPYVTYAIIAMAVAAFVWSLTDFEHIINTYGFIPADFVLLTLFTSMFLHGGIGHIFGNMWFLFLFGDNVEDKFGKIGYVMFYLASGLAAALVHYLSDTASIIPTIGASGAISGVLGAYAVFFPHAKVHTIGPFYQRFTLPAYAMLGLWFAMQFLGLFGSGGGIAFWAHIGGFVFGAGIAAAYRAMKGK